MLSLNPYLPKKQVAVIASNRNFGRIDENPVTFDMADLRFIDNKRTVQTDKLRFRKKFFERRKSNSWFEHPVVGYDLYIITAGFGEADLVVIQLVDLSFGFDIGAGLADWLIDNRALT